MSYRNTIIFLCCACFSHAWAEEPPSPIKSESNQEACRKADLNGMPPPVNVDCTEYLGQLELQAKRMGYLVQIQTAQEQMALSRKKTSDPQSLPAMGNGPSFQSAQPVQSNGSIPIPIKEQDSTEDRVIEVFGDMARIRYRGGDYLVRQGQRLPQGVSIEQVSLDGVVVSEGKHRRALPFFIGVRK